MGKKFFKISEKYVFSNSKYLLQSLKISQITSYLLVFCFRQFRDENIISTKM